MRIEPGETRLIGRWLEEAGAVVADSVALRIAALVREHLVEIARANSGWDVLYRDPDDGRLWERTYPMSYMHGAGPPELRNLTAEEAAERYRL